MRKKIILDWRISPIARFKINSTLAEYLLQEHITSTLDRGVKKLYIGYPNMLSQENSNEYNTMVV
jgi:hypothetical protein